MQYYIFGIQRSGTNFTEKLMKLNFSAIKRNSPKKWKHSLVAPPAYNPEFPTLVIYKNPYTWLESIAFRNTVDWLLTQRKYPATDSAPVEYQVGPQNLNLMNLIRTYKEFHDHWVFGPHSDHAYYIKYEDMLVEEKRNNVMSGIAKYINVAPVDSNRWIIPSRGSVGQSRDYNDSREQYYIKMKPMHITQPQIDKITEILGADFIERMGYTPL